jgi:hypothetical protein
MLFSFIGIKIEANQEGLYTTFSVVPRINLLKTKKPAALNGPAD